MADARHLTLETVDFRNRDEVNRFPEQIMAEGLVKARAENAELISRGQMDAADNLPVTERPAEYLLLRGRLVPGRVHFLGLRKFADRVFNADGRAARTLMLFVGPRVVSAEF
jgi:hypothetical protein